MISCGRQVNCGQAESSDMCVCGLGCLNNLLAKHKMKVQRFLFNCDGSLSQAEVRNSRNWVPPFLKLCMSGPGTTCQLESSSFLRGRCSKVIQNYSVWVPLRKTCFQLQWIDVSILESLQAWWLGCPFETPESLPSIEVLPPSDLPEDIFVGDFLKSWLL